MKAIDNQNSFITTKDRFETRVNDIIYILWVNYPLIVFYYY